MKNTHLAAGIAALIAMAGAAGTASAATVTRDYLSHGTANCQGALPVFETQLRKRPAALANEGTSTAFVTCDLDSINNGGTGTQAAGIFVTNRAGADGVTISCTLVDAVFTANAAFPKTSDPIAAGAIGSVNWSAAGDNAGGNFAAPAISCGLPAGVDISFVRFVYPEEVGDVTP